MFIYLFLAVLGLHCCPGFYLVVVSWGYSIVGCRASHCSGSSCCGARAVGCTGSSAWGMWAQYLQFLGSRAQTQQLWHTGLVAQQHVGSSHIRDPLLLGGFLTTEPPGKPIWLLLTEINIAFSYESVTTHLDIYIIDLKMYAHTKLCTFIATVFCIFLSVLGGM